MRVRGALARGAWGGMGAALCLLCGVGSAHAADIEGSSQRVDSSGNGAVAHAFDGDLATSWVEGAPGLGRGEWLEARFKGGRMLQNVAIFPGRFASETEFFDYAHVEKVTVSWTPPEGEAQSVEVNIADAYAPAVVWVRAPVTSVRITLDAIYDGARFSEANVAEVAFDWGVVDPKMQGDLDTFRASKRAAASVAAEAAARDSALATLKDGTGEGLGEAIPLLSRMAARGSDVDRGWLEKALPPGFALTYLRADPLVVDALGQAKAVSALPALQMAAAREWEASQRAAYTQLARWMKAYEEFVAPAPASVPYWGSRGSVPGTFLSLGEPLSIAAGSDGSVYVADVGNNRIERFDPGGRIRGTTPGARTIASDAFGKPVDPYVVGAAPGDGPGAFRTPLYVTVATDGGEERVVAIDATFRVQVLTTDLKPLAAWRFPEPAELLTGIGLRWPLVVPLKDGQVAVIVKDLAVVYDLKGEELLRFQLEGEPVAAAATKKRLLVAFGGDSLVAYTFDGRRDKVFFTLPKEDRSEDLDVTVDELGTVVVHTDAAFAYQLDKKGRLVQVQRTFKQPTYPFRIAARAGVLYVTAGDSIHRFELLAAE